MPYYGDMNPRGAMTEEWRQDEPARQRTIANLLSLRAALEGTPSDTAPDASAAPPERQRGTLLLGTWNLREFDSASWGARLPESYAYIAEIINRFDLVAIQEVRADLGALEHLRFRLGAHWQYLVSDVTEGKAGNQERLAFLYDTRKVRFLGIAGELVIPPVTTEEGTVPAQQIARTPLMAGFQVGWTKFMLATVHIIYGEDAPAPAARVEEIKQIAEFLGGRADTETEPIRNIILLGDFNIYTPGDDTMKALLDGGDFQIPSGMNTIPGSNVPKDKKYDQIAFRSKGQWFENTGRAGAFDYYDHVMRPTKEDADTYRPYIDTYIEAQHAAGKKSPKEPASDRAALTQYKTWRTYQMSDHLPLWTEFRVDFSDEFLDAISAP